MSKPKGRKTPRVYCRYGENGQKFVRFCPKKPLPENVAADLRKQIASYFEENAVSGSRRHVEQQTSIMFYLGRDGKEVIAQTISVFERTVRGPFFAQDNIRLSMEEAWNSARQQLGLTEEEVS